MEKLLSGVGSLLYGMRFTMLFFYVGLVAIIFGILGKFLLETYKLMSTLLFGELDKIGLIIKVLELVDMTMVAQLVWVVALAGVSLFVTTGHFDKKDIKKPDWLDHVNTYNLKLKLAFAIISISGVHALMRISAIVDARFSLIVDDETASSRVRRGGAQALGLNVAQSSTISLKRSVSEGVLEPLWG